MEDFYSKNIISDLNPFNAWLFASKEDELVEKALFNKLKYLNILKNKKKLKILDMGCSWGCTSFRVINVLNKISLDFTYYALDPFIEQLNQFKKLAEEKNIKNIRFIKNTLENFNSKIEFDLVFTSHTLYYVQNIEKAIEKLLNLGKSIIIIHQGENGIKGFHKRFHDLLKFEQNIDIIYPDLLSIIQELNPEKEFEVDIFVIKNKIDVSSCQDENSDFGKALISFFLNSDFSLVNFNMRQEIHDFFKNEMPEYMENETGLIMISKKPPIK